jgi:hypothetical protein
VGLWSEDLRVWLSLGYLWQSLRRCCFSFSLSIFECAFFFGAVIFLRLWRRAWGSVGRRDSRPGLPQPSDTDCCCCCCCCCVCSLCPRAFLVMRFALFVVRSLSLSIRGVWSVELVQYINWGSGCSSIPFSHTGITIRSQRMLYSLR